MTEPWKTAANAQLIFLCLMLGLVLLAMNQAGKPENWSWMFGQNQPKQGQQHQDQQDKGQQDKGQQDKGQQDKGQQDKGQQDKGQQDKADLRSKEPAEPALPNAFQESSEESKPDESPSVVMGKMDRESKSFWKRTLENMTPSQQLDWLALVTATAEQELLPEEATPRLRALLHDVNARFQQYQHTRSERFGGQEPVGSQEDPAATRLLGSERVWQTEWLPSMNAVLAGKTRLAYQTDVVKQLPMFFRSLAEQLLEDGRPIQRQEETYAWFDAWQQLQMSELDTTAPLVTTTSLLAQPGAYRGKTVSIEGKVLEARRLPATSNGVGMTHYYELWVKPKRVSKVPFCLLVRTVPETWAAKFNDDTDPPTPIQLNEVPIRVPARFYKNRIFFAEGTEEQLTGTARIANAPVLLANDLGPMANESLAARPRPSVFGWEMITLLVLLVGYTVWRVQRLRRSSISRRPEAPGVKQRLQQLAEDGQIETVAERLAQLRESELKAEEESS